MHELQCQFGSMGNCDCSYRLMHKLQCQFWPMLQETIHNQRPGVYMTQVSIISSMTTLLAGLLNYSVSGPYSM